MLFIFYDVSQSKAQDFAKKKIWLTFLLCLLSFRDFVGFSKSALFQFLFSLYWHCPGRTAGAEQNANKDAILHRKN